MADWTPSWRSWVMVLSLATLATACGEQTLDSSRADRGSATAAQSASLAAPPSCGSAENEATSIDMSGGPDVSVPLDITLVPHPIPASGVYQAGIPVTMCWGGIGMIVQPLASCSLSKPTCDVRSRWMPGAMARAGGRVTVNVADLNALVSVRVESVATGEVLVEMSRQSGTPGFDAPSEPGDYLVGIDLTGAARTLSYVMYVRVTTTDTSRGGVAMTFPVNAVPPPDDGSESTATMPTTTPPERPLASTAAPGSG